MISDRDQTYSDSSNVGGGSYNSGYVQPDVVSQTYAVNPHDRSETFHEKVVQPVTEFPTTTSSWKEQPSYSYVPQSSYSYQSVPQYGYQETRTGGSGPFTIFGITVPAVLYVLYKFLQFGFRLMMSTAGWLYNTIFSGKRKRQRNWQQLQQQFRPQKGVSWNMQESNISPLTFEKYIHENKNLAQQLENGFIELEKRISNMIQPIQQNIDCVNQKLNDFETNWLQQKQSAAVFSQPNTFDTSTGLKYDSTVPSNVGLDFNPNATLSKYIVEEKQPLVTSS